MNKERISEIEELLGCRLPSYYLSFLGSKETYSEGTKGIQFRDEIWPVRTIFELTKNNYNDQLDACYKLVYDVLPPFHIPVAEDWAGNLFCLVIKGNNEGNIVWWDHERDAHDHSTEKVTNSLNEFIEGLTETDEDQG